MARTQAVDSATSQFFVNLRDNAFLDHGARDFGYAVFGQVVEGLDVMERHRRGGNRFLRISPGCPQGTGDHHAGVRGGIGRGASAGPLFRFLPDTCTPCFRRFSGRNRVWSISGNASRLRTGILWTWTGAEGETIGSRSSCMSGGTFRQDLSWAWPAPPVHTGTTFWP